LFFIIKFFKFNKIVEKFVQIACLSKGNWGRCRFVEWSLRRRPCGKNRCRIWTTLCIFERFLVRVDFALFARL